MRIASVGVAMTLAMGTGAAQAAVVINGTDTNRTYDCKGEDATVNGNRNTVTLKNCHAVNVNGNQNTVDAGAVATLAVLGNGNTVTWSGDKPDVANLGRDNTVRAEKGSSAPERSTRPASDRKERGGDVTVDSSGVKVGDISVGSDGTISAGSSASGRSSGGALLLRQDSQTVSHDCKGADAEIHSDSNTVRLTDCRVVSILGDNNTVRAAGVESFKLSGDNNVVSWTAAHAPKISDLGDGNTIQGK